MSGLRHFLLTGCLLLASAIHPLHAQSPDPPVKEEPRAETVGKFLGGAVLGLALHEAGHLTLDLMAGTTPGIGAVSYAGIPFFAITHHTVTPRKEFLISSAGFWSQHLSSELLLTRRPHLREAHAPVAKGLLTFNVLTSVMYAGAAIGRTGPLERDTRGIAVSARIAEPWVAPVILAPAVFDALRYYRPESKIARWGSRASKVGALLLAFRPRS